MDRAAAFESVAHYSRSSCHRDLHARSARTRFSAQRLRHFPRCHRCSFQRCKCHCAVVLLPDEAPFGSDALWVSLQLSSSAAHLCHGSGHERRRRQKNRVVDSRRYDPDGSHYGRAV